MALLIRPNDNNTMDQSSKRSRRSWSTIAASHDPYASTSSLLSSTQDINDPTSLISGGGKIRSRPSLGGLHRLKGSKSKRQSVPALSTNSILRRSSNKKRVSSSSREELSREGHVKSLPTNCQSTPLICNRTGDNKSSAPQQRVCFEDDPSRDDVELDVHNEQWDEIIRPKRPDDTSTTLSNNLTTATTIGTAKEVPLKFDKHPKTATTSSTSSRLPKLMLSSTTPFFGKKFKRMEEESSQPIPINRTSPTPQETEDETKAADETLHYDMATWQMYTRIAQARRRKAISSQSRDANCSSGASTAAARHGMMMHDNRHSYVSNEEEEVPQANKEEEDIGVFAFDL